MATLPKSLAELDALAEDMLSKSEPSEELKPEDISQENAPTAPTGEKEDTPKDKADEAAAEKGEPVSEGEENKEDIKKCDDGNIKKSDEPEPVKDGESSDPEDESNGDKQGEEQPEPEEKKELNKSEAKEDMAKSLEEEILSDSGVADSVDASEFLKSIVSIMTKSLADSSVEIEDLCKSTSATNEVLVKSLAASMSLNKALGDKIEHLENQNTELNKSITSLSDMMDEISEKLDTISHQPAGMRKSVNNIQTMDRNFVASLNGVADDPTEHLSKAQVLDVLNSELFAGNPSVTPQDVISYESGAPLRPEIKTLVSRKCSSAM
jgi:hypothetical protein